MKFRPAFWLGGVFLAPRFLGALQSYYQDEAKWALIVDPVFGRQGSIPHPPLGEALYSGFGYLAGYEHLRWFPFLISAANVFLVFRIACLLGGSSAGKWAVGVMAWSFYSVWTSTQIDTDASLVPFFALLAHFSYLKRESPSAGRFWRSNLLLCLACAMGVLVKVVFILVPVSLFLDSLLSNRNLSRARLVGWARDLAMGGLFGGAVLAGLRLVYPEADLFAALRHGQAFDFFAFDRATVAHKTYEVVKAIVYASPWLVLLMAGNRTGWGKSRPIMIYLVLFLFFHLVLVGLQGRPIDRYLAGGVPFVSVLVGLAGGRIWAETAGIKPRASTYALAFCLAVPLLAWLLTVEKIIPLYPKSGYVRAVLSLDWEVLLPFRGGSGPAGFYAPVGFLIMGWAIATGLGLGLWRIRQAATRRVLIFGILVVSCTYNLVLIEEYLFGFRYGNADRLAKRAVEEVIRSQDVSRVITYNDVGAYELVRAGKYAGRFYAVPEYWEANLRKFRAFKESFFLVINFPILDVKDPYGSYFQSCRKIREWRHGDMEAFLARCVNGGRILQGNARK